MQLENVHNLPKNDQNRPKNVENQANWLKNIQKLVSSSKIPTQDKKNAGLPLKILLLVSKPTEKLLPSFPHNLHLCLSLWLFISKLFRYFYGISRIRCEWVWNSSKGGGGSNKQFSTFQKGRGYLPELFRQIRTYLPELFRQIRTYMPEHFRQIKTYLPELLK